MFDLFFSGGASWFSIPAFVGTLIFALRLGLMLIGGDHHGAGAVDADAGAHHGDPSSAFQLVSFQTISAFLMGAGWSGLAAYRPMGLGFGASTIVGALGGAAMVWALAALMKAAFDLQSSGTVAITDAIGREADVYVSVPAVGKGRGQVTVVIDTRQRTYNAVSASAAIPRGARARVVGANQDNTVTVIPVV